ncbi:hypothetical protein UlMin_027592 [Ulmus minor]
MMHGPCGDLNPNNIYNQWVVPYNPYLLAKFNCHINVEIYSTVKAVKYLYKYIYKGHDRITFHINSNNNEKDIDEIQNFQSARWISPPEAIWRIYSFILNEKHPFVYTLQSHLENQQLITFKKTYKLNKIIDNDFTSRFMLTEYFNMNKTNENAKTLLYNQFPKHFVWNQRDKFWMPRKKGHVIGRIFTTNPSEGERYYLRLLLNHIRGATCFQDLRIINNVLTSSFRESALLRGFLKSDNNLTTCLEEASLYEMLYILRQLFVTILAFCEPNDPKKLWEKFQVAMFENYSQLNISSFDVTNKALQHLAYMLESMGKNINQYHLMNFRSKKLIALATASSRVAAAIMPGGRTAHSRFKLPLDIEGKATYSVSKQSGLAKLLQITKLIIWDEAPMTNKRAIEAVDIMLQDINDCNLLFGGKVIIFGGDFRQVLPVVPQATKEEVINASLVMSYLWPLFIKIQLSEI